MNRVKKIVLILSIITTIALFLGGIRFFSTKILKNVQSELNAAVKPMYTEIIASHWDSKVIKKYASPEYKKTLAEEKNTKKISTTLRKLISLGNIKTYKGIIAFETHTSPRLAYSAAAVAQVSMTLDKSPVLCSTYLVKIKDRWYLTGFNVYNKRGKSI